MSSETKTHGNQLPLPTLSASTPDFTRVEVQKIKAKLDAPILKIGELNTFPSQLDALSQQVKDSSMNPVGKAALTEQITILKARIEKLQADVAKLKDYFEVFAPKRELPPLALLFDGIVLQRDNCGFNGKVTQGMVRTAMQTIPEEDMMDTTKNEQHANQILQNLKDLMQPETVITPMT